MRDRRIVETADEGIWPLDAEARTAYVNRRMADLPGAGGVVDQRGGRSVGAALDEAHQLVNDLMGRGRELSLDLRPTMLDDFGLVATLTRLTAELPIPEAAT